jgi:hypothetical protein
MNENARSFAVSVIVFREDSAWTALALEMDIRGYGPTPEAAVEDVLAMLSAQVSFAVQMGHPESVWHPADQRYWDEFEEARRRRFVAGLSGSEMPGEPFADMVPFSLGTDPQNEWVAARA